MTTTIESPTTSTLGANKAVYRRFIDEVFNAGRIEMLDEILAPEYVFHDAPEGGPTGAEAVKNSVTMFRKALGDFKITIEDIIAEGDKCSIRSTMRGVHQAELFGIPATGNKVEVSGLTMVTVRDGQIVESWVKNDVGTMMKQLGAKPK